MKPIHSSTFTRNQNDHENGSNSTRGGFRMRRVGVAVLLVLSLIAPACTPEQIETSVENIAISFEQGGVERGLFDAVLVINNAIPDVGMLLGYALGP